MTRTCVRDAVVLTADAEDRAFDRGHVVIEDDRIAAVGPGDPPADRYDEVVGHPGLVAIPGLVNCHGHGWLACERGLTDDADLFAWAERNFAALQRLTDDDFRAGSALACREMALAGITTAVEACRFDPAHFAEAALAVGIRSFTGGLARGQKATGAPPDPAVRPNWPQLVAQTEAALARFGDDPRCRFFLGAHSPYNCPPELLAEVRREAVRLHLGLGIHLAETEREDALIRERYGVSPTRYLADNGWLGPRTLVAHAVWLDDADIALLVESGTPVAHCPTSNAKLASGVAPVPALRDRGVVVGLGTDSVLSNNRLDLFAEMKFASLLQRATHRRAELLSAAEVFRMATFDGARAIGWAGEIGSLEPGKQADVVLLEMDHPRGLTAERALSDLVWASGPDRVRDVMVAGRWVVRDRALVNAA